MDETLIREVREETGLELLTESIQFAGIQESIFSESFNTEKHVVFVDFFAQVKSEKLGQSRLI